MVRGLVFFDVDGTLAPTSSGQYLAELFGSAEVVREVQAGYGAGTLSSREAAVLEARAWATQTPARVRGFLASLPLVDGVAETVHWCRRRRLVPVLATLAWDPVSRYLCDRFGFPRACGPRLRLVEGCFTGEVAELFDESDKRDFGLALAGEMGVDPQRCAAVGDGRSDIPLFAAVGFAVAFNASPEARRAAHVSVDGGDLRAVLPALDGWLSTWSETAGASRSHHRVVLVNARDDESVTLDMPARIWAGIDAGVDNAVSLAAEDGDEATVELGLRIRRAGWDQVPWVNGAWPPMDRVISVRLTVAEWRFAADEARRSLPIYERLGDDESARLGRDALAVIELIGR